MASRIQVRRGTEADWTNVASSVTLAAGEPAVATGNSKGPLLYFGDGTTLFSGLKAQVASFTPQSGSNTRNGHITATNDDYTFGMLETGDARSGDTYGMGNGSTLHVKDGATMTFGADGSGTGTTVTVHDNVTTDFRNTPSLYDGVVVHVGLHTGTSSADGTVSIKRDTTDVVVVDDYGNVAITPVNDSGTVDPNFMLKMSDNADVGLQVRDPNNDVVFAVHDNYINSVPDIILGPVPDHAIPSSFAVIRSGTTPNNTDSGALSDHIDAHHAILHVQGGSTNNQRGQLVLTGNRSVSSDMKAIGIKKNGVGTLGFQADYAGNLALTGQLTAQKYVVPNHPCQVRITQTTTVTTLDLVGNLDATAISFTKLNALTVSITPATASSKFLIEVSCMGGDNSQAGSTFDRPEYLCGTLFRKIGSGADTDLSPSNTSNIVKALFMGTGNRHDTRGTVVHHTGIIGQHLDDPSYTLGQTLTYTLGVAVHDNEAKGISFNLNKSTDGVGHELNMTSLIKVTEIPE